MGRVPTDVHLGAVARREHGRARDPREPISASIGRDMLDDGVNSTRSARGPRRVTVVWCEYFARRRDLHRYRLDRNVRDRREFDPEPLDQRARAWP